MPPEPRGMGWGPQWLPHGYHVLKAVPVLQLVPQKASDGTLLALGQGPHLHTLVPQGHAKEDPEICGPCPIGTCEQPEPLPHCPVLPCPRHKSPWERPEGWGCCLGSRTARPGGQEPSSLSTPGWKPPPEVPLISSPLLPTRQPQPPSQHLVQCRHVFKACCCIFHLGIQEM